MYKSLSFLALSSVQLLTLSSCGLSSSAPTQTPALEPTQPIMTAQGDVFGTPIGGSFTNEVRYLKGRVTQTTCQAPSWNQAAEDQKLIDEPRLILAKLERSRFFFLASKSRDVTVSIGFEPNSNYSDTDSIYIGPAKISLNFADMTFQGKQVSGQNTTQGSLIPKVDERLYPYPPIGTGSLLEQGKTLSGQFQMNSACSAPSRYCPPRQLILNQCNPNYSDYPGTLSISLETIIKPQVTNSGVYFYDGVDRPENGWNGLLCTSRKINDGEFVTQRILNKYRCLFGNGMLSNGADFEPPYAGLVEVANPSNYKLVYRWAWFYKDRSGADLFIRGGPGDSNGEKPFRMQYSYYNPSTPDGYYSFPSSNHLEQCYVTFTLEAPEINFTKTIPVWNGICEMPKY